MPKPKAKTFQQRLGFVDDDLKSQTHDDILKWFNKNTSEFITDYYNLTKWNLNHAKKVQKYVTDVVNENKENLKIELSDLEKQILKYNETISDYERFYKNALKFEKEENLKDNDASQSFADNIKENKEKVAELKEDINEIKSKLSELNNYKDLGALPKRMKIKVTNLIWEPPISTMNTNYNTGYKSSKYIIGFLDLMISFQYYKLTVSGINFKTRKVTGKIKWDQTKDNINLETGYSNNCLSKTVFLEVKTKIDSLGALFRQLRTYKEYIQEDIIVICPSDDEKDLILKQGFGFYKFK